MLEAGYLAKSLAGHDKGKIYVIMAEQGEYIYLSDGRYHKVSRPKKKNKKHVQPIGYQEKELAGKLHHNEIIRDEEVREVIQRHSQLPD